jgi:ATP-dependent helicase HrpB
VAKQHGPSHKYKLTNGRFAKLGEQDPLIREKWLAIAHLDGGSNEGKIYLAASLDPDDILSLATRQDTISWDTQKEELIARSELRIGEITVSASPLKNIPDEARQEVLLGVVRSEGLRLFSFSEETKEWMTRLNCLRKWRPDDLWPDFSDIHLIETAEEWLSPYLTGIRKAEDFKKLDIGSILGNSLPWELKQRMESLAPAAIQVPSGSMIKLSYSSDGSAPVLAVRLQEMFGLLDTPAVNEGRNKVMLHLLSPGYKPVQVTQDLRSFWKNTYPEVRSELRVRYQKHHWPEDPWTAEAVRGARKKPK